MGAQGRSSRVAAILFALLLSIPAAAQTGHGDPLSAIRIDNFGRINPNYFRGAQPVGQDYSDLAALGVKTVIDLTMDGDPSEAGIVQGLGMSFRRIPMTTRQNPSADQLAAFLQLVNDPASQPVYVHCQGGRHRTGVMTAVYRMTNDGWSPDKAFSEMKQFNYGPDFLHPEFKRFVYSYQAQPASAPAPNTVLAAAPAPAN